MAEPNLGGARQQRGRSAMINAPRHREEGPARRRGGRHLATPPSWASVASWKPPQPFRRSLAGCGGVDLAGPRRPVRGPQRPTE
eukprot:8891609-Pyramimonas_sp.AAC.1